MKNQEVSIAIIITCYNRRELTLRCISQLANQEKNGHLQFYVCDDASTDNTFEAIREKFPQVNIISSKGNLYWSKGMNVALKLATSSYHDFYLMVNDDVDFNDDALSNMLDAYKSANSSCGIVGFTRSKYDGSVTYTGQVITPLMFHILNFGVKSSTFIEPKDTLVECDVANFNCFLIDNNVIEKVGLIDDKYVHRGGDYDYCLRMRKKGFKVYVAPTFVGLCERNEQKGTFHDSTISRKKRIKNLFSPKGLHPVTQYRWSYKYAGILGTIPLTIRYVKILFRIILKREA